MCFDQKKLGFVKSNLAKNGLINSSIDRINCKDEVCHNCKKKYAIGVRLIEVGVQSIERGT
jgi:hypothetical protein